MGNSVALPLTALRPANITALKEPGLLLPIEPGSPAIAITLWGDEPTAIILDGPHSFTFFQIQASSRAFGLFVPIPEIVVTTSSASRGEALWDKRGSLMLEGGQASVVASRAGDAWGDAVNVPLWQEVVATSAAGKTIGFSDWSFRVNDGQHQHTIWAHHPEGTS